MDLAALIRNKCEELGVRDAAEFFAVSPGTISNWTTGKTEPSLAAAQILLNSHELQKHVSQEITMWEGRRLMILQPVYKTLNPDTHYTMFANYAKYGPEKIGMQMEKGTLIYEARNILVEKAKKADPEYVLFWDDDMIAPCGNVDLFNGRYQANVSTESASFNAISRIMSHPPEAKIVGALYFGRHRRGKAQCSKGFASDVENERLHEGYYKGLIEDEWVGTGFMRIHMSVFKEFDRAIDEGMFPECVHEPSGLKYGYFNPMGFKIGEDVSFCRRAKKLGIKTYVDTSLILLHAGDCLFGPKNTREK